MIYDYFSIAVRNLNRRKLRSLLTMLGIFISVATIFVLISLSLGLQGAVEEQFRLLGSDKIFVQPRGTLAGPGTAASVELTKEDINVVKKVSGVKDYTYWVASPATIEFGNEKRFFTVVGYPFDQDELFFESGAYEIDEGRFLEQGDENRIMIGSQYKRNDVFRRPIEERDKFVINGVDFKVKSILEPIGSPPDDRLVYMGLDKFREVFPDTGQRIDTIIVQIENGEDINEVADRIQRKLYSSRDVDDKTRDFTILTPDQLIEVFGAVLNIITGFLLGVAGISLIVGGIGIANTMYTSVLERTKEIGVMKAIGARNRDVALLFVIESGLLGLVGGVIGILLGLGISRGIEFIAINQLGTTLLAAATPLYLFVGLMAFAFLAGAVFGVLPALRASRIVTVDALRYE